MINSTDTTAAELLLQDADFPDNFENMQHPDDYKPVSTPFIEYIPHFSGHHNRLIVRLCWRTTKQKYIPMSFVCDTGAPMGLYLSEKALYILKHCGRVVEDETGNEYTTIHNVGRAAVEQTPPGHAPANLIGLRVLVKLGLSLNRDTTFVLHNVPESF
jgi:hypothetical protein